MNIQELLGNRMQSKRSKRVMNIQELLGKRALLKLARVYRSIVDEYKILEISPSGNWVKLQGNYGNYGNKFWMGVAEIALVEVLKEIEPHPAKDGPAE